MAAPASSDALPVVVGIGASAGGLEALLLLLPQLPRRGLAYVLAQHMANVAHGELLLRLLQRGTALPITLAQDSQCLFPGQVCLVPPGRDALVIRHQLRLVPPLAGQVSTPSVNRLFLSLAQRGGGLTAGLVLSGAGTDGAVGCAALQAAGGLVLVQAPAEAKFDGMPEAALAATGGQGVPLARMAPALVARFAQAHPEVVRPPDLGPSSPDPALLAVPEHGQELAEVLALQKASTGVDFSGYKEDTLLRGLSKRKLALGMGEAPRPAYRDWLARHPDEAWRLQSLFLVTVSSFFRDAEAFEALEQALRPLRDRLPPGQQLRAWVPACATGEEAYSLAILLHRLLVAEGDGAPPSRAFTVFATDLNPQALAVARAGCYRPSALNAVPASVRARYFHPLGEALQVCPEIRESVQWTEGNVLTQAPPEHLDLVSCRNLMIYLQAPAQAQLLARFHASLRPQGLLFIGQSESLALDGQALFAPLDYFHRIFVRKDPPPALWRYWDGSRAPSTPPAATP